MTVKIENPKPRATKLDVILRQLGKKSGATVPALVKATVWKPQSVRAAMTGLSKKGYQIDRSKNAKGLTVYRLSEGASR